MHSRENWTNAFEDKGGEKAGEQQQGRNRKARSVLSSYDGCASIFLAFSCPLSLHSPDSYACGEEEKKEKRFALILIKQLRLHVGILVSLQVE